MNDLFAPPTESWQRLSPAYASVRRIELLIVVGLLTAGVATVLWLVAGWVWGVAAIAAGLALIAWRWFHIARWVAAWGYAERDADLYLGRGLWFKELTVIPYGRMQAVKVESGPLSRAFGLAKVQVVTASLQSNADIPGLAQADAERLRDRLTAIGIGDGDGL